METVRLFKVSVARAVYASTYYVLASRYEVAAAEVAAREAEHGGSGFHVIGIEIVGDIDGDHCNVIADGPIPRASVLPRRGSAAR